MIPISRRQWQQLVLLGSDLLGSNVLYVVLFLSCSCLLMFCIMSCFVWTLGRVAAAFATANGEPNKITNNKKDITKDKTIYIHLKTFACSVRVCLHLSVTHTTSQQFYNTYSFKSFSLFFTIYIVE
jgi:hypothetical protein